MDINSPLSGRLTGSLYYLSHLQIKIWLIDWLIDW